MFDFDDVTWLLVSIGEAISFALSLVASLVSLFVQTWFGV